MKKTKEAYIKEFEKFNRVEKPKIIAEAKKLVDTDFAAAYDLIRKGANRERHLKKNIDN